MRLSMSHLLDVQKCSENQREILENAVQEFTQIMNMKTTNIFFSNKEIIKMLVYLYTERKSST